MLKRLIGRVAGLTLTGRTAWLAVGIVTAAVSWAGWTQWRIGNLHERLGTCRAGVETVADVAAGNAAALTDCRDRLANEISQRMLAEDAERRANQRLETETELRRDLAERERIARREAYDAEDCNDWARQPVCTAVADSLRRAARGDRGAGGGDSASGDPADP